MNAFAARVRAACRALDSHVCVGLDPRAENLPAEFGVSPNSTDAEIALAYEDFCDAALTAIEGNTAVVKPQIAFFEALGAPGIRAFWNVVTAARSRGFIVIADVKRGDIDSTSRAYGDAYFPAGAARLNRRVDAVTLNPYMGIDAIVPVLAAARQADGGVFVLVKTSNPSAAMIQDLVADGMPVHEHVATMLRGLVTTIDPSGFGDVGAVIGATQKGQLARARILLPSSWILIPGVGAQGGALEDVVAAFDDEGSGALVNLSRAILFPWLADGRPRGDSNWRQMIRAASESWRDRLRSALNER